VADDEAVAQRGVVDHDLLDAQIAGDGVVAALARERGLGLLAVAPELLAEDVVSAGALQVAAVLGRLEAAVGDPHHAGELPGPELVLDLADQLLVARVARPAPHADRDAGPGDRHPDHDLRQIGPVVLGLAVGPERRPQHASVLVGHVRFGLAKYVEVVSKNSRSTSRLSRSAVAK
jgi:hypothetical protein